MSSPVDNISSLEDNNYGSVVKKAEIANLLNTSGSSSNELDVQGNSYEISKEQQDTSKQQKIDKIISEAIKGKGLSLNEAKKMIDGLCNLNDTENLDTIKKMLDCLRYAIEDCTKNGVLDKEKLRNTFGIYVLLTHKSDNKQKLTCDQARATMKMSLVQLIKLQNKNLANKRILSDEEKASLSNKELQEIELTAQDIADTIKTLIKNKLANKDINNMSQCSADVKEMIRSLFGAGLAKCSEQEMKLLTEAFIILLKDNNLQNDIKMIVNEVCKSLKDNPDKLNEFINTTLVEILKKHRFSDEAIQKICLSSLGDFLSKNPDKCEVLLQAGIDFLMSLKDSEDLPILLKILDTQLKEGNIDNLSQEEIAVLNKYKDQISSLIMVYAAIAGKPDLENKFEDQLKKLSKLIEECGLNNYFFNQLNILIENNSDLFNKNDLTKILNKLTENKYSEAIGDTNPDNLSKTSTLSETRGESGLGIAQKASSEEVATASENAAALKAQVVEEKTDGITIERNVNSDESFFDSFVKSQLIRSGETFTQALAEGLIKIDDAGKDFNNACKSVQLKVLSFLDTQKNRRLDFLNKWHNSSLVDVAVNKFNFTKDQIEELKLSIGKREVLVNRYDRTHRTEEEDMA